MSFRLEWCSGQLLLRLSQYMQLVLSYDMLQRACCAGTPLYNLQALTALQSQVPSLPYSKQWQLPQPVSVC